MPSGSRMTVTHRSAATRPSTPARIHSSDPTRARRNFIVLTSLSFWERYPERFRREPLLAGTPVDALTEQIGVACVPRILLDQVHDDVPDRHGAVVVGDLPSQVRLVEGVEPRVGLHDLGLPAREPVIDGLLVARGTVEVPVTVVVAPVEAGAVGLR